jgi:hypothetical protein
MRESEFIYTDEQFGAVVKHVSVKRQLSIKERRQLRMECEMHAGHYLMAMDYIQRGSLFENPPATQVLSALDLVLDYMELGLMKTDWSDDVADLACARALLEGPRRSRYTQTGIGPARPSPVA